MSKYVMIDGEKRTEESLAKVDRLVCEVVSKGVRETDHAGDEYIPVEGAVLVPESIDKQDHIVAADEIKEACHRYMMLSQKGGEMHEELVPRKDMVLVECHIAKQDTLLGDQTVPEGTWIVKFRVYGEEQMEKIAKGEYQGFSIGGVAGSVTEEAA